MTPPKIENIDINSVAWKGFGGTSEIIKTMRPGQAVAITHEGYRPEQCGYRRKDTTGCRLQSKLLYIAKAKRPDVKFSFKHLPDGRLGVGCFAHTEE